MFQDIYIVDYQSEMEQEIMSISDSFFGTHYFKHRILPLYHHQKNSVFHVATTHQHKIVGFAFGFCIHKKELSAFLQTTLPFLENFPEQISILNTIVVKTEFQNQHIGTQLIKSLLHFFESKNIRNCIILGWKHENTIYADYFNQKIGFSPIIEIPDFWREEVLSKKYQCSVCGDDCHCSAVVYYKKW